MKKIIIDIVPFYNKKQDMSEIRWYRFLNNKERDCLSKHYSLNGGLVVRHETNNGNFYAFFRNHVDFVQKTRHLPKNFHEVIMGNQKAHFDFDKAESREDLYFAIEEVSLALLKLLPITADNLLLFTSHGKDKNSAHLVINGYFFRNNLQTRELCNLVCKQVSEKTRNILDIGVYGSVQCFRMLGSSKLGQNRVKKYEKLVINGQEYSFTTPHERMYDMELLRASLVSQVSGCKLLPDLYVEKQEEREEDLQDEIVKETMQFCRRRLRNFPFKKRSIEGNIINLQRIKPSLCPSCKRVHENENPFIKLNVIDVYFGCRRGKIIFLGQLGEDDPEPLPFEEKPRKEKKIY